MPDAPIDSVVGWRAGKDSGPSSVKPVSSPTVVFNSSCSFLTREPGRMGAEPAGEGSPSVLGLALADLEKETRCSWPRGGTSDDRHRARDTSDRQAAESQWAVETHGLTKRFGENVAVERRGAPRPAGMRVRIPRPERRRQDHADPGAARADARRCGHDVPARIPGAHGTATWRWRESGPSSTSPGSTAI